MADLMRRASEWLSGQLQEHCSEEVTYTRGGQSAASLKATIGQQPLQVSGPYQSTQIEWANTDFTIEAADLDFGGGPFVPQAGDRITRSGGTVYLVSAPKGEAVWRWADAHEVRRRIHAKQVS